MDESRSPARELVRSSEEESVMYSPARVTPTKDEREVKPHPPRQLQFGWTADSLIAELNKLGEEEYSTVAQNVCKNVSPSIVMFYANPMNSIRGRLRVEQEIVEALRLSDFSDKIFVVSVTTRTTFQRYLSRFRPSTFCFVGHCDEEYVGFCDDTNRVDPVPLNTFCDIVKDAYNDKSPALVGLFACKTTTLATKLFEKSNPEYIICWNSLTEDGASRKFGQLVMQKLLLDNHNIPTIFDESVNELRNILSGTNRKFGDPGKYLSNWGLHREKFKQAIQAVLDSDVNYRTVFYNGNNDLDYEKRRFPDCLHCDPKVAGVLVLMNRDGVVKTIDA